MWWKYKQGYFLLELLASLAAWLMLCLFIVPLLIDLNNQSLQLEVQNKAEQLLYEELQAKVMDAMDYNNYSLFHHGIEYKINWKDQATSGQKEVCVKVEKQAYIQETEMCAVPE